MFCHVKTTNFNVLFGGMLCDRPSPEHLISSVIVKYDENNSAPFILTPLNNLFGSYFEASEVLERKCLIKDRPGIKSDAKSGVTPHLTRDSEKLLFVFSANLDFSRE